MSEMWIRVLQGKKQYKSQSKLEHLWSEPGYLKGPHVEGTGSKIWSAGNLRARKDFHLRWKNVMCLPMFWPRWTVLRCCWTGARSALGIHKRLGTCFFEMWPFLFFFFFLLCDFFHWVFISEMIRTGERSWGLLNLQRGWWVPVPIPRGGLLASQQQWAQVLTLVSFCSQHALPVPPAHGNVSLQKGHCNKVFQDPEWPLQGRAHVLPSCQLNGCSCYWCGPTKLTRALFLAAEFFQSNTSTFSMCCKVRCRKETHFLTSDLLNILSFFCICCRVLVYVAAKVKGKLSYKSVWPKAQHTGPAF